MSAPVHIPISSALLTLTCFELVLAVTQLGLLAFLQWLLNDGDLTEFANFHVLPGATGVGLFVTCHSIIYSVYILVATRKVFKAYNKIVAIVLALGGLIFWLVTWGMFVNVCTLYGTTMPIAQYSSDGVKEGETYVSLGHRISVGIFGAILALAIVEWLLFLASTVMLFRSPSQRHASIGGAAMSQKKDASVPSTTV